jgi:trans-aconitate 2-methyltransferase
MDTNATVPHDWNPDLYLKFSGERTRAAVDLIARIQVRAPRTVIDVGCGPGNSTQALAARFPNARLTGLDNSPAMIAKARSDFPQGEWILGDAASFESARQFDVVFSNAAIQWIPDHGRLIGRMAAFASPGGALAVQTPMFRNMPIREAIARTAARPRWIEATSGCDSQFTFYPHGFYYDQLSHRAATIDMWETNYVHAMASVPALVEWMRATGLRPYLERLPDVADKQAFEEDLLEELRRDYHPQPDGKVLFPFRRLFFIAYFP